MNGYFAFCESISRSHPCLLHIISRKKLLDAAREHGDMDGPLDSWYRTAKSAAWRNIGEVRQVYSHADGVRVGSKVYTVFNISGKQFSPDDRNILRGPNHSHQARPDARGV